jgi:hypothetical protein
MTLQEDEHSLVNIPDDLLIQAFAKLDKVALGIAIGVPAGLAIFFATVFLLFKGGSVIGPNLSLLGQYFIGYTVTWKGSVIGLIYGLGFGFILGWCVAFIRNLIVAIYVYTVKLKANLMSMNDFIDHL